MPIQTLRGLACLLLVLFHVVGNSPASGLRLPEDHMLAQFNQLLASVRMPLFAGIAGWVYAIRPCGPDVVGFLGSKVRRLLFPLIVVGLPFTWLQAATPLANAHAQDGAALSLAPAGHFWFLESLFIVFLLLVPMERLGLLRTLRACAIATLASAVLLMAVEIPAWLDPLAGALYLMIFFLIGLSLKRFALGSKPQRQFALLLLTLAWGPQLLLVLSGEPGWTRDSIGALGVGALVVFIMVGLKWQWRPLVWLGEHSYAVFLFHVFFTAAARIALRHLGVDSLPVLVLGGLAAGVFGPVAVGLVIGRYPLLAAAVLGERLEIGRRAPAIQRPSP